jgi:hypothetical protein
MEKQPINIWGKPFCELPSGKLCDACCNVKEITNDPTWKNIKKLPGENCGFMNRKNGKGEGCRLHGMGPDRCDRYHCSKEPEAINKMNLIDYALRENVVSKEEADQAVLRLLGK